MLRKRIKKKKPLKLFTKQKLHSKSTYFYTKWFLNRKTQASDPANGFRVSLSSLRENSRFPEVPSAIQTRLSRKVKNPYGGITRLGATYALPVACSLALLLVLSMAINPTIYGGEKSYALEDEEMEDGETAEVPEESEMAENQVSQQAELAADTNDASVSLIVDNGVITDTIIADTGSTTYRSHTITIKGDNIESYSLQISATNNGTSALQYDGGGVTIPGANGKKGSELTTNTWGYGWSDVNTNDADLTYYTLPEYGAASDNVSNGLLESVQNIQEDSVDVTKKLTFAANFGNVPDGHYTTSVMLSLAVEPKVVVLSGITDMQEMDSGICWAAKENEAKQLRDSRDGKYYWVAKLKDGNCWMTQNLDLDLSKSVTLTPQDTDVKAEWTPDNSTLKGAITQWTVNRYNNDTVASFDVGQYVQKSAIKAYPCATGNGVTSIATCSGAWVSVDGYMASTDANYSLTYDTSSKVYNAHYTLGNYYTWRAATAASVEGTGKLPGGYNASSSICPKGWRLPTGGSDGDYSSLLNGLNSSETETENNAKLAPYYFTMSGYLAYYTPYSSSDAKHSSGLFNAGFYGYYHTSTVVESADQYRDYLASLQIGYEKFQMVTKNGNEAQTIRCVAK